MNNAAHIHIARGECIAHQIRQHRYAKLRADRFIAAAFLRKCLEMRDHLPAHWQLLGDWYGIARDLDIGEFSLSEYLEDLRALAEVHCG